MLPILAAALGTALIYKGAWQGWGRGWVSAGAFFVAVASGSSLLTLAMKVPGRFGMILRHPVTGGLILVVVAGLLGLTVILGLMGD